MGREVEAEGIDPLFLEFVKSCSDREQGSEPGKNACKSIE